ncbi:YybH family protein [Pseudorhodoferax sp.]|uniref:YybH family protein n=1 Tax=Pseudorhodoferax sp. TaxID=1993553 RepID=UPI002DD65BE1|nr:nuclear transport factor 2 family protein [Pseudorhodoferax sp.]
MSKARLQSATFAGSADDTEAAFYDAMQHADVDAMMACWADEDEIVCVHPDGPRLVGAAAIRASYEALFAAGPVRVLPRRTRKIETLASAVHSVAERIEMLTDSGLRSAEVVATNVYLKTAQGWRLVAHHASADRLGGGEDHEAARGPQTLH